jgi:hypothetical protein
MRDRMAGRGRTSESDGESPKAAAKPPQRQKKPSREDQDVQRALKLSEQDEAERRRRIAEQGKDGLFDEAKPEPRLVFIYLQWSLCLTQSGRCCQ